MDIYTAQFHVHKTNSNLHNCALICWYTDQDQWTSLTCDSKMGTNPESYHHHNHHISNLFISSLSESFLLPVYSGPTHLCGLF